MRKLVGLWLLILGTLGAHAEDRDITRILVQNENGRLALSFNRRTASLIEFGLEEAGVTVSPII